MSTNTNISNWKVSGDWFDVCKCNIPCPCTFAQAPSSGDCAGILVWHIEKGQYSDTVLDGLNVLGIGSFTGSGMVGQASIFHLTGVVLNCSLKNPVLTAFIYFSIFSIIAFSFCYMPVSLLKYLVSTCLVLDRWENRINIL